MFNYFLKKNKNSVEDEPSFEIELTAAVLAYEIARIDGDISNSELNILMEEIETIAHKVDKDSSEVLNIIEIYSSDSTSFYDFVEDINKNYSKDEKLSLLYFMWRIAFADGKLDLNEEKLIRRLADLIKVKDLDVLKLKSISKSFICPTLFPGLWVIVEAKILQSYFNSFGLQFHNYLKNNRKNLFILLLQIL